jgi:predicted permease
MNRFRYCLRVLFRRERFDRDLEEEMQSHLEMQAEENRENGVDADEARYAARRQFGNPTLLMERSREVWGWRPIEELTQDVRYAIRSLRRRPGFTAVAVLSLGLGLGLNTAIFSAINALILRPLPVKQPYGLVALGITDRAFELPHELTYPDFLDYRDRAGVFSDAIAFFDTPVNFSTGGQAERIWAEVVTENYFSLLGVEAVQGRTFLPEAGRTAGSAPEVVLGYGFWQQHFGRDPSAIGKRVIINGRPFTVVGVCPPKFLGTEPLLAVDAYLPVTTFGRLFRGGDGWLRQRGTGQGFSALARLKPAVSLDQARAATDVVARQLEQDYPESNKGRRLVIVPEVLARPVIATSRTVPIVALVFMTLTGLVLLIACVNVADLMLARAVARHREMALRAALGAGRWRLVRQLLTESLLLALLGGVVGLLLGLWGADWLASLRLSLDAPITFDWSPDWRVFAFMLALALVSSAASGVVPAIRSSRLDLSVTLKEGGRTTEAGGRRPLRGAVVVCQVAVSLLLLICSGLFLRSWMTARRTDLGFRTSNLLMLSADLRSQGYDKAGGERFCRQLLDRVRTLAGVRRAALAKDIPFGQSNDFLELFLEGTVSAKQEAIGVFYNVVGTDYFATMGIPLQQGRDFTEQDNESAPKVAIVSRALARRLWPRQEALGKRVRVGKGGPWIQVVGLAGDTKYLLLSDESRPFLYLPLAQNYRGGITLHVHTAGDPAAFTQALREQVRALDSDLPVYGVKTMAVHLDGAVAFSLVRLAATLTGLFALLGLVLASGGVYGVVSYAAAQRTHEIGLRMALGAQGSDVLKLVVGQGMLPALIGIGVGLAGALALTRALSSLLLGVAPGDPFTFVAGSLFLTMVALAACYIPARRAARIEPVEALRYE